MYNIMISIYCKVIITISLVNIRHYAYLQIFFSYFTRTFKMCSLSNFEMFNSVVLTIVNKIVGKFSFVLNVWEMKWLDRVAQMLKNLPAMQETQIKPLGWKNLLEKGMATHCSILAWRIPWTEEPGGVQSMRWQRVGHDWATNI